MFCGNVTPVFLYMREYGMDPLAAIAFTALSIIVLIVTSKIWGFGWLKGCCRRLEPCLPDCCKLKHIRLPECCKCILSDILSFRRTQPKRDVEASKVLLEDPWELRQEVDRLQEELTELRQNSRRLKEEIDQEKADHTNTFSRFQRNVDSLNRELKQEKADHDETKTRLSALMGSRLRENNPNIVDLSNSFRPTKLAEISSELYDNEWTNAFSVIEDSGLAEPEIICVLLDIVMSAYQLCKEHADKQWQQVSSWIGDGDDSTTRQLRQALKDGRKAAANEQLPNLQMDVSQNLVNGSSNENLLSLLTTDGPVRKYVYACVSLCLHMVVQDPPVVWFCPGWSAEWFKLQKQHGDHGNVGVRPVVQGMARGRFDTKLFKAFMKAGEVIEFIVWPAMLLQEGGSVLSKGVAQGCAGNP